MWPVPCFWKCQLKGLWSGEKGVKPHSAQSQNMILSPQTSVRVLQSEPSHNPSICTPGPWSRSSNSEHHCHVSLGYSGLPVQPVIQGNRLNRRWPSTVRVPICWPNKLLFTILKVREVESLERSQVLSYIRVQFASATVGACVRRLHWELSSTDFLSQTLSRFVPTWLHWTRCFACIPGLTCLLQAVGTSRLRTVAVRSETRQYCSKLPTNISRSVVGANWLNAWW